MKRFFILSTQLTYVPRFAASSALVVGFFGFAILLSSLSVPRLATEAGEYVAPKEAQAATAQGNSYGLPNYSGYTAPTSCYSYQDYSRNYQNQADCRASNILAEFSAHLVGQNNGTTQYLSVSGGNPFVPLSGGSWVLNSFGPSYVFAHKGDTIRLEWSCQPSQTATYSYCTFKDLYGNCYDTAENVNGYTYFQTGSNFGPGVGTQDITVTDTMNATLVCSGSAGSYSFSIPIVTGAPTCNISANPNPTFVGNTNLTWTSVGADNANIDNGVGSVPTNSSRIVTISSDKTYTLTVTGPGGSGTCKVPVSTQFVCPDHSTQTSPNTCVCDSPYTMQPDNTCSLSCPANSTPDASGNSCVCNQYYTMQPDNTCSLSCPANSTQTGNTCICNPTFHPSGNLCVPNDICSDIPGNQPTTPAGCLTPNPMPGTCIPPGYTFDGSKCVLPTVSDFHITPNRVRNNIASQVTFFWQVKNPSPTCTLTGPAGFTTKTITPVDGVTDSFSTSITITQSSKFTLTCSSVSAQSIVSIIPGVIEI